MGLCYILLFVKILQLFARNFWDLGPVEKTDNLKAYTQKADKKKADTRKAI
jgi:hypothetical protein